MGPTAHCLWASYFLFPNISEYCCIQPITQTLTNNRATHIKLSCSHVGTITYITAFITWQSRLSFLLRRSLCHLVNWVCYIITCSAVRLSSYKHNIIQVVRGSRGLLIKQYLILDFYIV